VRTETWTRLVDDKLGLGSDLMRDLGNLYTAALPAWLAAGLYQAHVDDVDVGGQEWLALGYGSGDAAEALPMRVSDSWRDAARRINIAAALDAPTVDLTEAQYLALHSGRTADFEAAAATTGFVVDHVGTTNTAEFADLGIEYYRFVEAPATIL
jgi:hydroxymethylglutaryl-CoA synthase